VTYPSKAFTDSWDAYSKQHPYSKVPDIVKLTPPKVKAKKRKGKPRGQQPKVQTPRKAPPPKPVPPALLDKSPVTPQDLPYLDYLLTPHWRRARAKAIKLAHGHCSNPYCENTRDLEVHHLHYQSLWHERTNDVKVLCSTCHALQHGQYIHYP
jgi:hypothetical protein